MPAGMAVRLRAFVSKKTMTAVKSGETPLSLSTIFCPLKPNREQVTHGGGIHGHHHYLR